MSFASLLYDAVSGQAGGRMFPLGVLDKPVAPYLVYSVIARPLIQALEGPANLRNTRLQIDCWATTYPGAQTLADNVEAAMLATNLYGSPTAFKSHCITRMDFDDPDTQLKRVMLEFSIWHF